MELNNKLKNKKKSTPLFLSGLLLPFIRFPLASLLPLSLGLLFLPHLLSLSLFSSTFFSFSHNSYLPLSF